MFKKGETSDIINSRNMLNKYIKKHSNEGIVMPKYRIVFEDEVQDELYDSYEEAEDAALYMCSCADLGK